MRTLHRWTLTALLAAAAQAPALATTPLYGVTNLGDFFPTGVNDSGWVSGYDGRALLWRPGVGLIDLGSFGVPVGAVSNRANAVNNAGQVVGYTYSTAETAYRAFRWQEGSGLTDLGDLPDGANASRAEAINASGVAAGQATGQYQNHPSYGYLSFGHAARFDVPGSPIDLEAHPEGTLISIARGINDHSVVVGERQTADGWRALYWAADGTPVNLGALWGVQDSGDHSFARDVNNFGQVALQLPLAAGGTTAALWQDGVGFTEIGRLSGMSGAVANAVNDAGMAVGNSGLRGFAWTATGGLVNLNDRLDATLGAGWQIFDATAISESGLIVGRGWHPSFGHTGVLLTPIPEPAAALLMLGGVAALLAWRRRGAAAEATSASA